MHGEPLKIRSQGSCGDATNTSTACTSQISGLSGAAKGNRLSILKSQNSGLMNTSGLNKSVFDDASSGNDVAPT